MHKNLFKLISACGVFAIFLSGCGYTTRSMLNSQYKNIYISAFGNKINITGEGDAYGKYRINRPMLESDITKAVVNKFLLDGNLKPVKNTYADLTLKGDLVELRKDPVRYTNDSDVEEYRVSIIVNISLTDNKQEKVLWKENNFTGDTTYFTQGTSAKSEATAINDAVKDLSRRIVERAVEQW